MLIEICKGLWLNPYEITEVCVESNGQPSSVSKKTVVCIKYRTAPTLITTNRYDLDDEVATLEEAKRVAELVNRFCNPSPSWSDQLELIGTIADNLYESHGTISENWTNTSVVQMVLDAKKEVEDANGS